MGGNCVEVEASDGSRIVLDVGLPLTGEPSNVTVPQFAGPVLAALISHPHLDHYGLAERLNPIPPVYIGEEAARLLQAAAFFSPITRPIKPAGYLRDHVPFSLGSFVVTPYLVDHSGFDSYSLLIEADGRRLFYTGDFRGHGRKARLFEDLLANPPRHIDVLITEGTQVGGSDHGGRTESQLEDALVSTCAATEGIVSVFGSAQNVDRLVTAFRAGRRSGRVFMTDLYGATVAAALRPTIPQPGFDGYRVYVPRRQRVLVKQSEQFERVALLGDVRVYLEEVARAPERFLAYLPASTLPELLAKRTLTSAGTALWSMWDGYLAEPSGIRFAETLARAAVPFGALHTSGHATIADIRRLVAALAPRQVVPIHTDSPHAFRQLSTCVSLHDDGSWWAA